MKRCRDIIERYHFPRRELIIEVTESGYIKAADAPQMRENILSLRSLGVQVMFDDFGMGYSTFHDLQEYPWTGSSWIRAWLTIWVPSVDAYCSMASSARDMPWD